MKRKMVIIFVLSIMMLTMTVGTVGVAFADEIRINLIGDGFTVEEKELAIANLQLKFEDKELPTLLSVEELYDFNEEPLYGLYEFENYYMIVIRQTSSILERGECNSAYYGIDGKKYYGGLGEAYLLDSKGFVSLTNEKNTYASQEKVAEMKDAMTQLRDLDYQDYIEALNTPMPLGQNNRLRITMLGSSNADFNYFAREVNIDYCNENNYANIFYHYDDRVLYQYEGISARRYEGVYMRSFDYGTDLVYPQNVYNECSLVAMIMVLQFYERTGCYIDLMPFAAGKGLTRYDVIMNPMNSRSEQIKSLLIQYLKVLQIGSDSTDGAATYRDINYGFKDYFAAYNIDCEPIHFTSYTNIKKAVDAGNPAIMTVGAGKGYDKNNKSIGVNVHNLVVYGYTQNSIGVLDEFVCHANWHLTKNDGSTNPNGAETAMLFVNKFSAAGNVYLNIY